VYLANVGGGNYNYVQHPTPFSGNISVADCTTLTSLLKTIKIDSSVECRWCSDRWLLAVTCIIVWHQHCHCLTCHKQDPLMHGPQRISGSCLLHKAMMMICCRQTVQKYHFWPHIWRPLKTFPQKGRCSSIIMQTFKPITRTISETSVAEHKQRDTERKNYTTAD